jgi:hypothetical protein
LRSEASERVVRESGLSADWEKVFRETISSGTMAKHCPNERCPGLARDGVVAEFVDEIERCIDCGCRLIRGEAFPEPPLELEYVELRTVFIAADVIQGHLVAGAIESEGIPAFLKGEALRSAVGELPVDVTQLEVQVSQADEERARTIAMRFEPEGN